MFNEKEPCPVCKGDSKDKCEACRRTGLLHWYLWNECPRCHTSGEISGGGTCRKCGGFGYVLKSEPEQESALMDWCKENSTYVFVEWTLGDDGWLAGVGDNPNNNHRGATRLEALKDAL